MTAVRSLRVASPPATEAPNGARVHLAEPQVQLDTPALPLAVEVFYSGPTMDQLVAPAPVIAPAPDSQSERVPLRRVDLLFILGFWTFIALLTSANTLVDPGGRNFPVMPTAPVAVAFIESYVWAVLTPLVFALTSHYPLERGHLLPRIALFFVVGMLIAVAVDVVNGFMRFDVFHVARGRFADAGPMWRLRHLWFMNEFLVYIAILAGGLARDYFLRYRSRREQTIRLQAQAAQLQAQLADARLAALRTQLNPHFLFNTLHAVSALVERDPRGVRRMIARLSELLRTTLEGAEEQEVPLSQELTFTQRYLEIMQIRFQGRLAIDSQVEPDVLDALVPNLILQPLVENAIKHGVSKIDEPGRIEIRARREGERLVLSVRDNGPPVGDTQLRAGEGVGMRNTRQRLSELYGSEQSLSLQAAGETGVLAEVIIPYHTRADLRTTGVAAHA
jgi:two-component system, LytTR family, sensor kinase